MKAKLKVGRLEFEIENTDVKAFIEELAEIEEVFGATHCGACDSDNIAFRVRTVDDNKYYEMVCRNCNASKSFGQKKKGGKLFPKRKDKEGNFLPNSGWVKFSRVRDDEDEEPAVEPPKTESKPAPTKKAATKKKVEDEEEAPF